MLPCISMHCYQCMLLFECLYKEQAVMATNPSKPHDGLFKSSMMNIRVATDFFEGHLPPAILQKTDLATLQPTNHSFTDEGLSSKESDLVYKVQINKRDAFIYLLCEHQSTIDQHMALRILTYVLRIFTMHTKQNPSKKYLPIVYPMVVYNPSLPPKQRIICHLSEFTEFFLSEYPKMTYKKC